MRTINQDEGSRNYRRHGDRLAEELKYVQRYDEYNLMHGAILCAGARDGYEMYLLERLHDVEPCRMMGIDDCASMVAVGLMTGDYNMIHGDICDMGFLADGYFDMVFCSHTLEHLRNPELAVGEFCRVVRPGGSVWITVPKESPASSESVYHLHHFLALGNLEALCGKYFRAMAGWEITVKDDVVDLILRGAVPDG
jgi:SAM-dependent methyltransferase